MAVKPDQFCWGANALLTLLKLSTRNNHSGHQVMSPRNSYLKQNFNLIVIITALLLNILDSEIFYIIVL